MTCTATDAVRRVASCSFDINVVLPPPRLGVTTILAFGDSITEGEVPVAGEFIFGPKIVEPDHAYPADLATLLGQRYTAQGAFVFDAFTLSPMNVTNCSTNPPLPTTLGIVVINDGCLGEKAKDATSRLTGEITRYHPDVLLLLEGANDLNGAASIPGAVQGVQSLISTARGLHVRVMVGTLLPEIAGDVNAGSANLIVPFNSQLAPAATSAGATVIDLYSDIATGVTDWISPYDGLHPTEAGYQEIARVWLRSIQDAFEVGPAAPGLAKTSARSNAARALRR